VEGEGEEDWDLVLLLKAGYPIVFFKSMRHFCLPYIINYFFCLVSHFPKFTGDVGYKLLKFSNPHSMNLNLTVRDFFVRFIRLYDIRLQYEIFLQPFVYNISTNLTSVQDISRRHL
jgi:hypothetical protein